MSHNKTTTCEKCSRSIRNNNWKKHALKCEGPVAKKIRGIDFDPNWGYKAGIRQGWNKGTGKPDTRNPEYLGKVGGYRPGSGRSKKFQVLDSFGNQVLLQSTYEHDVFEILCELGARWIRPKALRYGDRNYFADFYLIDFELWLDPKNDYKAKQDEDKIAAVIRENDVRVVVLRKQEINKSFIERLLLSDGR